MIEFQEFPKLARLNRGMVVTEKLDGTNAAIGVTDDGVVYAQSRKKLITPGKQTDNYGLARWVADNADALRLVLGPGLHFGEWWGQGIQRKYGMERKVFSLFNTSRWIEDVLDGQLRMVPVLYEGPFSTGVVNSLVNELKVSGSIAAPGWADPEGVVVWHEAARTLFKVTCVNDETPKSLVK